LLRTRVAHQTPPTSVADGLDLVPPDLGYRPALDGLRALAVVAVIGYHLGYRWLRGGFIGVDLFFVLSGYLITSLLLAERHRSGHIDLPRFWLRRAKRLLPALLLVVLAVAYWEFMHASPFERQIRRPDLLWTLFYGSNWHFIQSGQDYFAQLADASPVRHTWSLAIEEQFYLVWPVLVAVILANRRVRSGRLAVICGAGLLASFGAMVLLYAPGDPSRTYYGTDTRIYQPLAGALLAVFATRPRFRQRERVAKYVAAIGLVLIGIVVVFLSDRAPAYWHGFSLLLTVIAAGVIWGLEVAPAGWAATLLSLKPLRWTGQVSYGLYLWHWPIILAVGSSVSVLQMLPGSTGLNLTRLVATFGVATASFYLVEQPFRRGRMWMIGDSSVRFMSAVTVIVAFVSGFVIWATRPLAPTPAIAEDIPGCPSGAFYPCLRSEGPKGAPVIALIGDSVARSLDPAFMSLAQKRGWSYVLGASNGCRITRLLTSFAGEIRRLDRECYQGTPQLLEEIRARHPAAIVAIDRWEIMDIEVEGRLLTGGTPEQLEATEEAMRHVARELTAGGTRLVFIELPPTLPYWCGRPGAADSEGCRVPQSADSAQAPYNAMFRRIGDSVPNVSTISLTRALCPNEVCAWELDGFVPRPDGLHFAPAATDWLAGILERELTAARIPLP